MLWTQTSHYNYIYIIHVKTDTQKAIDITNIMMTPYKFMVIRKGVLSVMRTKDIYAYIKQCVILLNLMR